MIILNTSKAALLHAMALAMARRIFGPNPTSEQVDSVCPSLHGRLIFKGRQVGATLGLLVEAGAL